MKFVSFGGGVQSTALLVLAARGDVDAREFVFSNVGERAENPDTLAYVGNVHRPYAVAHGLTFVEVRGNGGDLYTYLAEREKEIPIPIRNANSGAPLRRNCTKHWKSVPIARYARARGASAAAPAVQLLGISVDEWTRMGTSRFPWIVNGYPLIDLGLDRNECRRIVEAAGLPTPPRSACWFCPFHSNAHWSRLAVERPALYEQAVDMEARLSVRNAVRGGPELRLRRDLLPVGRGGGTQLELDDEDGPCDSGVCFV